MLNHIEWTAGLNGYRKYTLDLSARQFTTELLDNNFEKDRHIFDIFYDHLSIRQTKYVEVLYSGGLDSELVLLACMNRNIPVKAITMVIRNKGIIINTHDLYYAEKFCRTHNIEQILIDLEANEFYNSGKYLDYLVPYYITAPHVATHFWLLEQCNHFPVFGGDWGWVQVYQEQKVLSPSRLEFSSYERYMQDKGIYGIGNMIANSLESNYAIMKLQIENYAGKEDSSIMKHRIYTKIDPTVEIRARSYGWEHVSRTNFDLNHYKVELLKTIKLITKPTIKWNSVVSTLLNTTLTENSEFK